jgi:galactokinase
MTGAGFGGCTVSLVEESAIEPFMDNVGKAYTEKTGQVPEFYLPEIVGGAARI